MTRNLVCSFAVISVAVSAAAGQVSTGAFRVGPRIGIDTYEAATSIEAGALLGLDATYFFNDYFGIGGYLDFSRARTDGTFFPAEMRFNAGADTTLIFAVEQPLTIVKYGAQAVGTTRLADRFDPYALVGVGAYQIQLDPQSNRANEQLTEIQFTLGIGVGVQLGASTGIRFDVRDYLLTDFNRERLNPVEARFRPVRFPDVLPPKSPVCSNEACTTHNLVFALSFQFTPGGAR